MNRLSPKFNNFLTRSIGNFRIPGENLARGQRVAVAISGGVDSAVAAWMLKEKGFDVIGVHMTNWNDEESGGGCQAQEALKNARLTCDALGIELRRVSFVEEYWNEVFSEMLEDYQSGMLTPNPDVLCNAKIKFSHLISHVRDRLGILWLATGHYARLDSQTNNLFRGLDYQRDQSYFLSMVPRAQFQNVLFPLGELTKDQVRQIATQANLPSSNHKSSVGLCFVGRKSRKFSNFLQNYVAKSSQEPGPILDLSGNVLGEHQGLYSLTIGQRARIGGLATPSYVVSKQKDSNSIFVVTDPTHPALFCDSFLVDTRYLNLSLDEFDARCQSVFRGNLIPCRVYQDSTSKNLLTVQLKSPACMRATAAGQVLALFGNDSDICFGAGKIVNCSNSKFNLREVIESVA